MKVLCQEEPLKLVGMQLAGLIEDYWYSTPENKDFTPIAHDWPRYMQLADMGICHVYTARDKKLGELVGTAIYLVMPSMKHRNHVVATCDTLCTAIKHRGQGIARTLMTFLEPKLIELGANEIINGARLVLGNNHLFPSLGFTAYDVMYSKKVG